VPVREPGAAFWPPANRRKWCTSCWRALDPSLAEARRKGWWLAVVDRKTLHFASRRIGGFDRAHLRAVLRREGGFVGGSFTFVLPR